MINTNQFYYIEKSFTEINEKLDKLLTILTVTSPLHESNSGEVVYLIDEVEESTESNPFTDNYFTENKIYSYDEMLQSIIKGKDNRILLLRDGYEFSNKHTKSDVFQYIAVVQEDVGYPIELIADHENNLGFRQIPIEGLTGIFYGAVCFNEVGLIFYYSFNNGIKVHSGNTLTLVCNNKGI